jgi:murein DD-endopeptidase MepM/ murein hydrolase activator NlpD
MRIVLAIAFVVLFGLVAVSVSADQVRVAKASATPRPYFTVVPAAEPAPATPVAERAARQGFRLAGRFVLPLAEVPVPDDPDLLPGATRDYRAGYHEGIDFPAPAGTAVRAAAGGRIVRVDTSFFDWTREQQEIALYEALQAGYTSAATLDRIRGRQVWIDHGSGIVTRYAHLSAVAPLTVGQLVEAGALLGEVGSSGYPQGGPHLHFEVRIGDDYFGDGLKGDDLVRGVNRLFR